MMHLPITGIVSAAAGGGYGGTLLDGLVSWWDLEEASGTRFDSHGSNHLTVSGSVGQAAGKAGNCADFTGGYLHCAAGHGLQGDDRDFTLTAWVNFDALSSTRVIASVAASAVNADTDYIMSWDGAASRLRHNVPSGAGNWSVNFGSASSTATWYWVEWYFNDATNKVGISVNNGTRVEGNGATNTNGAGGRFTLGAWFASSVFDGKMDSVNFYSRLLTNAERTELYNGGDGIGYDHFSSPPPVLEIASYTKVDPGTGGVSANNITLTKPSGVAVDDLLMLIVANSNTIAVGGITDMVDPSGWTPLAYVGTTNTDSHLGVWWRIATGSEGATVNIANSDFPSNTYKYCGFYLRITGADTTTPIDVSAIAAGATNGTAQDVNGVTTTVDGCLILAGISTDASITTHSYASPYTLLDYANSGNATFVQASVGIGTQIKATAGATGNTIVTISPANRANEMMIAIRPA